MFSMFLVLTIQGCDLLNPPPPPVGVSRLAGSQAGVALSRLFSVARSLAQSAAKVIKARRAVHSGVVCISVCLCVRRVLLGRESWGTLQHGYSWHLVQSPLCDPHLGVSGSLVVGTVSHRGRRGGGGFSGGGGGGHSQLCVPRPISCPIGGSSQGKTGVEKDARFFSYMLSLLCSSTQAHCPGGV